MQTKNRILIFVNDERIEIEADSEFTTLAEYLRYKKGLCGTKIVCAEGDCGACTVLMKKDGEYKAVNSCIIPLYLSHGHHIVTVEGIHKTENLHPVQTAMIEHHGAQCGYCTPGFICAMTAMVDTLNLKGKKITEKRVKNYLTGNLCRCTGYLPIIQAATAIDQQRVKSIQERYINVERENECAEICKSSLQIENKIYLPATVQEALEIKDSYSDIRVIAGSTDIGVQINKGKTVTQKVLALYQIPELNNIEIVNDALVVGATVTLSKFEDFIESHYPELKQLLHIFASPQIKNQGTLVGNVVNASPIADTIPFLLIQDAVLTVESLKNGRRHIPLTQFYLGYKNLDLQPDEIVLHISIPMPEKEDKIKLYKVSLRKDLDISAVTFAGKIHVDKHNRIAAINIALGGVAPTVIRLHTIEKFLLQKEYSLEAFKQAAAQLKQEISPLSDLRGSKEYRLKTCENLFLKFYHETKEADC